MLDEQLESIANYLELIGFDQISSFFIIPKNVENIRSKKNRMIVKSNHMRYEKMIKIRERKTVEEYYIRSHGLNFNLIRFEWYETWKHPIRIFTIGNGLYGREEVNIFLAQVFGSPDEIEKSRKDIYLIEDGFLTLESIIDKEFDVDCLRVSGVIRDYGVKSGSI